MLAGKGRGMLNNNRQRGFTLIEAMVVITILAIVMATAVPVFTDFIVARQIRGTAESILNGIQLARTEAIRRNTTIQFVLGLSGTTYTNGWEVKTTSGSVLHSRSAGEAGSNIALSVVSNGATMVTFNGIGRRTANSDASNPARVVNVDVPTSVMPATQSPDLRIIVLSGGLIRMCDPNIGSSSDPRYCPCDPAIVDTANARYCS
jgi:type IV fimbrial biogenesis protein FimT